MADVKKKTFVAISAIWFERYLECSRTQGTEEFVNSVWRFYHSLLNLGKDKLAIKDMIREYVGNTWQPMLNKAVKADCEDEEISFQSYNQGARQVISNLNQAELIIYLFEFIIQTIQDSGVGWPSEQEMQTFIYSQE